MSLPSLLWAISVLSYCSLGTIVGPLRTASTEVGRRDVLVALIDTGFDHYRAAEYGTLWTNPLEATGSNAPNGLDDDENGYVDDWVGWDWIGNDNDPFDWPAAEWDEGVPQRPESTNATVVSHGTAMADVLDSTLLFLTNATGTRGSSHGQVKLQNLRVAGGARPTNPITAAQGIRYAVRSGAGVVVVGFSVVDTSSDVSPILESIEAGQDTVFVLAAGNSGTNLDHSQEGLCRRQRNVICVAATAHRDDKATLAQSSNYGPGTVDAAAEGGRTSVAEPEVQWVWRYAGETDQRPTAGNDEPSVLGQVLLSPLRSKRLSCEISVVVDEPLSPSPVETRIEVADERGEILAVVVPKPPTTPEMPGHDFVSARRFSRAFSVAARTPLTVRISRDPQSPTDAIVKEAGLACAKEEGHGSERNVVVSGSSVAAARAGAHVAFASLADGTHVGSDLKERALARAERVPGLDRFIVAGRVFGVDESPRRAPWRYALLLAGVGMFLVIGGLAISFRARRAL